MAKNFPQITFYHLKKTELVIQKTPPCKRGYWKVPGFKSNAKSLVGGARKTEGLLQQECVSEKGYISNESITDPPIFSFTQS